MAICRAPLDAAEKVLERDGQGALSLRAVAREAGVSPAAPYHHFKDKEELLFAVGKVGFTKLNVVPAAATGRADLSDRLSDIGLAHVEFAQEHPATCGSGLFPTSEIRPNHAAANDCCSLVTASSRFAIHRLQTAMASPGLFANSSLELKSASTRRMSLSLSSLDLFMSLIRSKRPLLKFLKPAVSASAVMEQFSV